jgi:putative tryptophan/tyrosine transport system substrate-binding protein
VKRREFIAGLAAAGWPFAASGQQTGLPVIGFLNANRSTETAFQAAAFRKGLSEFGYMEGQNVFIEYRWGEGKYEALPALARELVDRRVTVICATPSPAAVAAKAATSTIPVVFTTAFDAVRLGLVASFNRPGGNLTGLSQLSGMLGPKRLELLRGMVPDNASIALLANPSNRNAEPEIMEIQKAARALGQQLFVVNASTESQLESAFASIVEKRAAAVLLIADGFLFSLRERIVALTLQHRMPAIFENREYAEAGGLLAYGANNTDNLITAGQYVGRILKGAKPSDLPVVQPTKFELVINLRTARAIGLDVPPTLLALADEVIE